MDWFEEMFDAGKFVDTQGKGEGKRRAKRWLSGVISASGPQSPLCVGPMHPGELKKNISAGNKFSFCVGFFSHLHLSCSFSDGFLRAALTQVCLFFKARQSRNKRTLVCDDDKKLLKNGQLNFHVEPFNHQAQQSDTLIWIPLLLCSRLPGLGS